LQTFKKINATKLDSGLLSHSLSGGQENSTQVV